MSLYGLPKTGKTRLACTFPKPLLIIGSEDGTASVVGTPGVDFVQLENCYELGQLIEGPVSSGKYASVVLDNASKFRDMRIAEILGLKEVAVQKGWGFATRDQWVECSNSMKQMLRPILWLGRQRKLNVVIIAHEQNFTAEETGGKSSDLLRPNIGPALGKSVCDFINAECDFIGQTHIREQTATKINTVNGKEVPYEVKTGKAEYCLRIAPTEFYQAGFRVSPKVKLAVDYLVDPTYAKIMSVINGKPLTAGPKK